MHYINKKQPQLTTDHDFHTHSSKLLTVCKKLVAKTNSETIHIYAKVKFQLIQANSSGFPVN